MVIELRVESSAGGTYVDLFVAIFDCDFGFIDYVLSEEFIYNRAIGIMFYNLISPL